MVTETFSKYNVIACEAVHKCRAPNDAFQVCVDKHIEEYILDMVTQAFIPISGLAQGYYARCQDRHTSLQAQPQVKNGSDVNVVLRERTAILQRPTRKAQMLLNWRDAFCVLVFGLDITDGIRRFYFNSNSLVSQGWHKHLHDQIGWRNL